MRLQKHIRDFVPNVVRLQNRKKNGILQSPFESATAEWKQNSSNVSGVKCVVDVCVFATETIVVLSVLKEQSHKIVSSGPAGGGGGSTPWQRLSVKFHTIPKFIRA